MHTPKLIKIYFSFVMSIVAVSMLMKVPAANEQIMTAVAFFDLGGDKTEETLEVAPNPFDLDFKFEKIDSHARPGDVSKEVMKIALNSSDAPVDLQNLRLKLLGISGGNINAAYLQVGENVLGKAVRSGQYFNFQNLDYELKAGEEGQISLLLDLGNELMPHDIVKFEIEQASDLKLEVGKIPYQIAGEYPIKGNPIFIVK